MKSPYTVLEIGEQATDAEIKQAYLQKVKQYPPDHHHEQFQMIHQAYEAIKDFTGRTKYALFSVQQADFDALLDHAFKTEDLSLLSADHFEKLLSASINENIYKIAAPKRTKTL